MFAAVAAGLLSAFAVYKLIRFFTADADLALLSKGPHRPGAFQDKVVWITGASQGFGEVLVRHFAALGAKLIISSRSEEKLEVW